MAEIACGHIAGAMCLDGGAYCLSCPPMQRAQPFRMSIWRLGLLVLGWYGLVLQALLGGQLAARAAFDPAGMAALCSGDVAFHGSPGTPLHVAGACDCIAHCSNVATGGPPRTAFIAVVARSFAVEPAIAAQEAFIPVVMHFGAPVRGPPERAFHFT